MADKKISDLTAASSLASGDLFEIENAGGNSRKVAWSVLNAHRGALVYKSSNQTGQNFTTDTAITFDSEDYDTDGFHSTVSNTDRITIPSGVSKVRLKGAALVENVTAGVRVHLRIYKNGVEQWTGGGGMSDEIPTTALFMEAATAVVSVSAGDYFQLVINVQTDTSVDLRANLTWFAVEVAE